MANRDQPMGMRAVRDPNGSHPPVRQYDAQTAAIYEGQLVLLTTDGLAIGVTTTIATTVKNILGVAAAFKAATSTAGAKKVQVYWDPMQQYVMQSDDGTLQARTNYIGRNFTITNAGAGNTTTLQSKAEITGASGTSASNVGPIQVIDLFKQVGNQVVSGDATASANADFLVRILPRYHLFGDSKGV